MTVASQNFQIRQFHWDVGIYSLTKVTSRQSQKSKNKTVQSGFGLWQQPMRFALAQTPMRANTLERFPLLSAGLCAITETLTAQWLMMPITHCHPNAMWEEKKAPSELKWLSLLSQSLALFLFPLLRGWNSVKHALVLTWDGYGNMFSYPWLLFSAKSFTGGLIQTGGREEMLKLVKS